MATELYSEWEFTFKWRHDGKIDKKQFAYKGYLTKAEAMNAFRESEFKTKILMVATPVPSSKR